MSPSLAISGAGANWWATSLLLPKRPRRKTVPLDSGRLTVHVTDRRHFGATLLHATGSAEHLERLRALAEDKGMKLDADG
jgi:DNA polymerase/3'-5' exonuclease PolX